MFSDDLILDEFKKKATYNDDHLIHMFKIWLSSYKINKCSDMFNYPYFDHISYALNFLRNDDMEPNFPENMKEKFRFKQFISVFKNSDLSKNYSAKIILMEEKFA